MGCIIHGWLAWGGWSFSGWSGGSIHQSVCVVAGGAGVCFDWAHSDGRVNPVMVMRGFLFRSQACFFCDRTDFFTMDCPPLINLPRRVLESLKISTEDVVQSIEHLLRGRMCEQVWNAPKAVVQPPDGRYMMAALCASDDPALMAVKTLILNPANRASGRPAINALITLLDSRSGWPVAVMDGNWITAVRTAGLSAVAARRLARPDAAVAAFIGCGVQAHSHLEALADLFPLREIRAFGRGEKNREALCRAAERRGLQAVGAMTAREAVSEADIVVTSVTFTPDVVPFLDARWLKPGVFAAITDHAAPWVAESLTAFDRIVVDDVEQERRMPTPLVDPALVAGDLTGLVGGTIAGRDHPDERTAFIFRGLALGDLALSALAYQRAVAAGAGIEMER